MITYNMDARTNEIKAQDEPDVLNFDKMIEGAAQAQADREAKNKAYWQRMQDEEEARNKYWFDLMDSIATSNQDKADADMLREIEQAKAKAEAEIRARYEAAHGVTPQNESKSTKAFREFARSL